MTREHRPPFDATEMNRQPHDEARNCLLFDWWCDEDDRLMYIASLPAPPTPIFSRAPRQNDPAPPLTEPAPQGRREVYLVHRPDQLRQALTQTEQFSNIPYAALGGASFLLGLDPGPGYEGKDWHAIQQALVHSALDRYTPEGLRVLARKAVEQAALTSLARPEFDLAQFAEQAGLRYLGLLFGYGFQDHGLLEEASRATYRALQYLAIGQHFVTEPATLLTAQQALGRLVNRSSELMDEYTRLGRSKRRYGWKPTRDWPKGVLPWSELGLSGPLGQPLLKRLPGLDSPLSGRDRATIVATLLAGTLGNIQSAVCLLTQALLKRPAEEQRAVRDHDDATLEAALEQRLARLPPVPVLPRRTRGPLQEDGTRGPVRLGGVDIPHDSDVLLLLEGQPGCPHSHEAAACPRIWGQVEQQAAPHACLGRALSLPLIAALVQYTLRLQGLKPALDALTGEALKVERLWGFACTRYPLRYDRERARAQQNLIVSMRIKPPISENAARLRRLIAAGAPRIDHALSSFGHVHFAWFEFSDDDSQLVLRTLYDGQFEAYVQHFALRAGDLFDGLFEFLEGAPQTPVAEHPHEFVETLLRLNRAPLAGYLFSAYPRTGAEQVRHCAEPRP